MNKMIYKIDAAGKILGRVASEAALALRGKTSPHFVRHLTPNLQVTIVNAGKMKVNVTKKKSKTYARYSGYPGGLRFPTLEIIAAKQGLSEPLKLAIRGMLPRNKLRAKLMNQLQISE